jgi:hypothetical protein
LTSCVIPPQLEAKKGIVAKAKERKQARKETKNGHPSTASESETPADGKTKKKSVGFSLA